MLDLVLCDYPIYSLLVVMLMAGASYGAIGWVRISTQARAAWDHAALIPIETASPNVYRAELQRTEILRLPLLVRSLGFMSYALYAGHAGAAIVFVDAAFKANGLLAAAAAALAGFGVVMSRCARALVLRTATELMFIRRRVVPCAILAILVYGAIILSIGAFILGWLDTMSVDVYYSGVVGKWEGHWETMTLRQFIEKDHWILGPRVAGYLNVSWRALGRGLLAYACGAFIEAVLILVVARRSVSVPPQSR
jgi:hypothetical protein